MTATAHVHSKRNEGAEMASEITDEVLAQINASATPAFVAMGIVDDVTTCECCGRSGLKRTVMLGATDLDGNVEGVTYYGTGCAAVALGRPREHGAKVAHEAAAADRNWRNRAERAREVLAVYGPAEGDKRATAEVFFTRNPHMRTRCLASVVVAEMLADARAVLAERGLTA